MILTAATLSKASPGDILRDPDVSGLHARVTTTGTRYFLYYRTRDGRERRPKLGDAAVLNLTQARERAKRMLLEVASGRDPSGDVQSSRAAPTLNELAERFKVEHLKGLKSCRETTRMLDVDVLRRWGNRKVASIDTDDVMSLRKTMAATPTHFNRVRSLLSKMFNTAETWKLRPRGSNPAVGVPRYPEKKRRRYMKPAEALAIAKLLDEYEADNPFSVAFMRLLILTGARPGEIAAARWDWLAGDVIHHPDAKTGERDIFLSPQAVEVLNRLPRTSGTLTGILSPQKLWRTIRVKAKCPDLRLYDLRHNFASVALSMGLTLGQIGELLGHKSTQTTTRYAHLIDAHKHAAAAATALAIAHQMEGSE